MTYSHPDYAQAAPPQVAAAPQQVAPPLAAPQLGQMQAPATPPTTLAHTNTFALVAIITAFLSPIAAIIFGHMALGQIKRTGDAGRGLALTGLIIGYSYFVMIALFVLFYISIIGIMLASLGTLASQLSGTY